MREALTAVIALVAMGSIGWLWQPVETTTIELTDFEFAETPVWHGLQLQLLGPDGRPCEHEWETLPTIETGVTLRGCRRCGLAQLGCDGDTAVEGQSGHGSSRLVVDCDQGAEADQQRGNSSHEQQQVGEYGRFQPLRKPAKSAVSIPADRRSGDGKE